MPPSPQKPLGRRKGGCGNGLILPCYQHDSTRSVLGQVCSGNSFTFSQRTELLLKKEISARVQVTLEVEMLQASVAFCNYKTVSSGIFVD